MVGTVWHYFILQIKTDAQKGYTAGRKEGGMAGLPGIPGRSSQGIYRIKVPGQTKMWSRYP